MYAIPQILSVCECHTMSWWTFIPTCPQLNNNLQTKLLTYKMFSYMYTNSFKMKSCGIVNPLKFCLPVIFYSMGAPVMVELEGETDPLQIAMKELKWVHRNKQTNNNNTVTWKTRYCKMLNFSCVRGVRLVQWSSHHCDPGSILGLYMGCDWLISIFWLQGFFSGFSGSPPSTKINFPAKICVVERIDHEPLTLATLNKPCVNHLPVSLSFKECPYL